MNLKDYYNNMFDKKVTRLCDSYHVSDGMVRCYLVNFEDDYICHKYNGGCKFINECRHIEASESI